MRQFDRFDSGVQAGASETGRRRRSAFTVVRAPLLLLLLFAAVACAFAAAADNRRPDAARSSLAQRVDDVRFVGERPAARSHLRAAATWCGAGAATGANRPDTSLSSPNLIHVTYALPADGADRFPAFANAIKTDVDAISAWWTREDASHAPRFDLADFSGCSDLDLSFVRLPQPGAAYTDGDRRLPQLAADLAGLAPANTKNLVYYDGPVPASKRFVCGTSMRSPQTGGAPFGFAFVWLESGCPNDLGQGRLLALVAAHELGHDLGAVMPGAPHMCRNADGHVCDSPLDLMYPSVTSGSALTASILDIGRDDYYGFVAAQHVGSVFDVQTSAWLVRLPQFQLSVGHSGNGSVDVAGPGGTRSCAASCALTLENGAAMTLTANPSSGSRLVSWRGSCGGSDRICRLTADAAKSVTAEFGPLTYGVRVSVSGKGKVTSSPSGISCPRRCRTTFTAASTLQARAAPGYRFIGWTGSCSGGSACRLPPGGDRSVQATFRRRSG